jgi:dTDP-4-amino-4,6-dideoxygalactose transaminase
MKNNNFSSWPIYSEEEIKKVSRVLLSTKVNYWTGNEARKFEKEFALWANTKYAVAIANGTVALDLAFKALDIGAGDEVIVTSRSFIASVSSIINAGATPIFVDIELESQNINHKHIKSLLSPATKAILCVHLAGWPCNMDQIMTIANENNLYVVEDCAQAHGAKFSGQPVGSIGHIGCWSFCQDKIMTTGGEGGMVTTNDENFWQKMWEYKDHGKSFKAVYSKDTPKGFKWLHESFGTNGRMTEMQAAIGRVQLKYIHEWHIKRLNNAQTIWDTAKQCRGLRVPTVPDHIEHAAYKCYVFVRVDLLKNDWSRDRIIDEINKLGVPCFPGVCSEVYLEKAFDGLSFKPKERLKNAKELGETSLMFLIHPNLLQSEMKKTCEALKSVLSVAV